MSAVRVGDVQLALALVLLGLATFVFVVAALGHRLLAVLIVPSACVSFYAAGVNHDRAPALSLIQLATGLLLLAAVAMPDLLKRAGDR